MGQSLGVVDDEERRNREVFVLAPSLQLDFAADTGRLAHRQSQRRIATGLPGHSAVIGARGNRPILVSRHTEQFRRALLRRAPRSVAARADFPVEEINDRL